MLRIGQKGIILLGFLLGFASGCARLTPEVRLNAEVDPAFSYFYGNLQLEDGAGFALGRSEIALRLEHAETGHKVSIRYRRDGSVCVVRVRPGRYFLKSVVFLDNFNAVFGERALKAGEEAWSFVARPGRAYYVGDSKGFVGWVGLGRRRFLWQVRGFKDRFVTTTPLFKKQYPLLGLLPVENALVDKRSPKKVPVMLAHSL